MFAIVQLNARSIELTRSEIPALTLPVGVDAADRKAVEHHANALAMANHDITLNVWDLDRGALVSSFGYEESGEWEGPEYSDGTW